MTRSFVWLFYVAIFLQFCFNEFKQKNLRKMKIYAEIFATQKKDNNFEGSFDLLLLLENGEQVKKEFVFFTKLLPQENMVELRIQYKSLFKDFIVCKARNGSVWKVDSLLYSTNKRALLSIFFPAMRSVILALREGDAKNITSLNSSLFFKYYFSSSYFFQFNCNSTLDSVISKENTYYRFLENRVKESSQILFYKNLPKDLTKEIKLL